MEKRAATTKHIIIMFLEGQLKIKLKRRRDIDYVNNRVILINMKIYIFLLVNR